MLLLELQWSWSYQLAWVYRFSNDCLSFPLQMGKDFSVSIARTGWMEQPPASPPIQRAGSSETLCSFDVKDLLTSKNLSCAHSSQLSHALNLALLPGQGGSRRAALSAARPRCHGRGEAAVPEPSPRGPGPGAPFSAAGRLRHFAAGDR